ncbi:hypothetical protein V492_08454 [Pseudogymnoascus sp. VKM F-4246]|nr:hypothetical protein V492_08454 [Pseudogymnoascus sp. VKM F-4246]
MVSPNPESARSPTQRNPAICLLPAEIVKTILDQVPNSTIKNLRLTCRAFREIAALRLSRVFISANPRNIEVFTAIAKHDFFRSQITEIIWDDTLVHTRSDEYYYEDEDGDENGIDWRGDVPGWFRHSCRENISNLEWYRDDDFDRPSLVARKQQIRQQMPMEHAWAYYQELLEEQRSVLDSNAHIEALEKHIGSFTALQRVTITAATHGWLYNPLYETPMIRAFPRGFNYHIPRTWPITDTFTPECNEWDEDGSDWQGFRTVTRVLAEGRDFGRVVDLRVDAHELEIGLNSRVFEKENRTLSDFEAVLSRPDFEHLQLDLMVDPHYRQADVFRSGLLKRVLARASCGQGLKSLSLRTNMDMYRTTDDCDWNVPLTTIFTPTSYSRLEHFGLSRFYVKQDDLLSLLASMPKTLRSVELSILDLIDEKNSYRTLLWGIRDTLGWKERNPRPTLVVGTDLPHPQPGRALWLKHELYNFLYDDGNNPFGNDPKVRQPDAMRFGFGWEIDCFDPDHKRPNVDRDDLADLGYIKRTFGRSTVPRPVPESPRPGRPWFTVDARYCM